MLADTPGDALALERGTLDYRRAEVHKLVGELNRAEDCAEQSIELLVALKAKGVSGGVYTQTTDVEGEINGLMTYDREVIKLEPVALAFANRVVYRPLPLVRALVPTAETLSLYDKAREPKALHMFPPIGHHAVYYGDNLPRLLGLGRDWFDRHLR